MGTSNSNLTASEIITIDTRTSAIQSCFQAHPKKVNTVGSPVPHHLQIDVHPNKQWILTASLARSVRIWDVRKLPSNYTPHFHQQTKEPECEECLHDYEHRLSVNSAFFSRRGDMVVTTCQDNHLRVYHTLTTTEAEERCVSIQHRNQTGKWLTKLMAEWYIPPCPRLGGESSQSINYFHCGSMDEPRQINVVVGEERDS